VNFDMPPMRRNAHTKCAKTEDAIKSGSEIENTELNSNLWDAAGSS